MKEDLYSGPGKTILITGGAGFIGSHLAGNLVNRNYKVRVLDNLSEQVHGPGKQRPVYLHPEAELIIGDVRKSSDVQKALEGVDAVCHFAALSGLGQSMYKIKEFIEVNNAGTAVLLEELIKSPVEKLILASSMSIYGEGLYKDKTGTIKNGEERSLEKLKEGDWELKDEEGNELYPVPTPESKIPAPASVYALTKYNQENLCMMMSRNYNIPVTVLRLFNVYGPRQTLASPYDLPAIFAARLLRNFPPHVFEDGNQMRDLVNVHDVTRACVLALEKIEANNKVFNIGSGIAFSVKEVAAHLSRIMNKKYIQPEINGKFRAGDIRHCFSDISHAKKFLGYEPMISFEEGLTELAEWIKEQNASGGVEEASEETYKRSLTV